MIKNWFKPKLLLLGGGFGNAFVLNKLTRSDKSKLEITIVSPFPVIYYLEMAGGYLEGFFSEAEVTVNLLRLSELKGVQYVDGNAAKIDNDQKVITLEDGKVIPFDILVVNPEGTGQDLEGVKKYSFPIRYGDNLKKVKKHFSGRNIDSNITIVGAGKLGIEIALSLRRLLKKFNHSASITLIDAAQSILHGYDLKIKKAILTELKTNRIELLLGRKVIRVTEDLLIFNDNSILEYGYLIWTANTTVHYILKESGLAVDEKSRLHLNQYLQSTNLPYVFGVGESIAFHDFNELNRTRNPAREADVLLDNILRFIKQTHFKKYIPATKLKKVIAVGNKQAVIELRGLIFKRRIGWFLKKRRDKKFLRALQS